MTASNSVDSSAVHGILRTLVTFV